MKPPWLRIVQDHPTNKIGPTIPFLLGALRSPVGEVRDVPTSRKELGALLVEMCDEPLAPWHVVIQPCGTPEKLVVNMSDVAPPGYIRIESPSKKGRALYCYPIHGADIHDVDSLEDALWTLWGDVISRGDFSYVDGKWTPFTRFDKNDIATALREA